MAKFCAYCGAKLKETSNFCKICGGRIAPPDAPAASSASRPALPEMSRPAPAASVPTQQPASQPASAPTSREANPPLKPQAAKARPAKSKFCLCGCVAAVLILLLIFGILAYLREVGHWARTVREADNTGGTAVRSEEPFEPNGSGVPLALPEEPSKSGSSGSPDDRRIAELQRGIGDILRESKEARQETEAPEADSSAFTRKIQKGVVLSVPENALGRGRKLEVKPVAKPNEVLLTADKQLKEFGVFPVAAWEVDAGLAEDERLPGYYSLRVDLGELGIDEGLYNQVRFYRLTDKGKLYEYSTVVEGRTASCLCNQNSFLLLSVFVCPSFASTYIAQSAVETFKEKCYYNLFTSGDKFYLECPTESGTFKLFWNGDDVDKDFYTKVKKLDERYKQIIMAEKLKYKNGFDLGTVADDMYSFEHNAELAEAVRKALEQDAEYQKLKTQIKRFPPFIERTVTQITTAYAYLDKTAKVKMPGYTVCFYLKTGLKALGYQVTPIANNPYLEINVDDGLVESVRSGGETWDNLLLTVTHELFHICQEEYHVSLFDMECLVNSKKYDEMVTCVLEADARDFYLNSKIITTAPKLTCMEPFDELYRYPMDMDKEGGRGGEYGYVLAKFVRFIRKKSGKSAVTAKTLMEARSYWSRPNISEPLMKCFGLNKSELGDYYAAYCKDRREANASDKSHESKGGFLWITEGFAGAEMLKEIEVRPSRPVSVSLDFSGPFSCRAFNIHLWPKSKKKDCAVIIALQDNAEQVVPCFDPQKNPLNLKCGLFIPSHNSVLIGDVIMAFLPGKAETLKTGFTAYAIPAPDFRDLEAGSKGIRFKVPKLSLAGDQGLTEGFLLHIKSGSGPAAVIPIEPDKAGGEIEVSFAKAFPQAQPGQEVKFTAALCEYAVDKDGKRCLCPLSKEISASVTIPESKAASDEYHYLVVPVEFGRDRRSRSGEISRLTAACESNIKSSQKRIARIRDDLKNNPGSSRAESGKMVIAGCQSSIEHDKNKIRDLSDPDAANFILHAGVLFIDRSKDGSRVTSISILGKRGTDLAGAGLWYINTNPGAGGSSFTGEKSNGERVSARLPLDGGQGSLSLDGKDYEIYRYDQETFDKYKKYVK